jgi:hypothetical protein
MTEITSGRDAMGTLLLTGGSTLVSQPPTRRGEGTDRGTRTSGVTRSIVRRAQVGSPRSGLEVQSASELGDALREASRRRSALI